MSEIIRPGEVTGPVPGIPHVRLPDRASVFTRRAARLRQLSDGHPIGDYLRFLAALAEAQQASLDAFPESPLPGERDLSLAREHGLPPLSAASWLRAGVWRTALSRCLDAVDGQTALPEPARLAMARLGALPERDLEAAATRVLAGDYEDVDPAFAPLLAAALQAYWVHLTTRLSPAAFTRLDLANLCPACGSRPVASVVLSGGDTHGLRYLVCSLCASEWHLVRAKCVVCDSAKDLAYFSVEPAGETSAAEPHGEGTAVEHVTPTEALAHADGERPSPGAVARADDARAETRRHPARHRPGVQAEACEACHSYLKIAYVEHEPALEPTADALAALTLDLRMAEAGYTSFGVTPLLVPGRS